MSNGLERIYGNLVKEEQPDTVALYNSKNRAEWIPLLSCGQEDNNLGIVDSGFWGIKISSCLIILDSESSYLYVLKLLEITMDQIESELKNLSSKYGLAERDNLEFPFVEIIRFAFRNEQNDYWLNLAFRWLDSLENRFQKELVVELFNLENNKNISQKMRHMAKKRRINNSMCSKEIL
ncbi:hypothetical protein HCA81_08705 [Listeria booriae]|uniref:hypothetical protein n=1 Tax=Listeria booriae TaxID=1552123 RepID=UPI001623828D|nr:hypothetical protein [Listeria booriae]MBC2021122.1 hypothetical protein [Listeria booriae]